MMTSVTLCTLDAGAGDRLGREHLDALARDSIAAIWARGLLPSRHCERIADGYCRHALRRPHDNVDHLDCLGTSHYMAIRNGTSRSRYFSEPNMYEVALREMAEGGPHPLERIRNFLAGGWPAGLDRETLNYGRRMSPFVVRIYQADFGVLPHQDDVREELACAESLEIRAQCGLNLYLSMPERGGELELYLLCLPPTAYEALRLEGRDCYAIDAARFGEPIVRLRPEVGDLILFNSRLLHAVAPGHGSPPRVTLSSFIGVRCANRALTMWA